MKRLLGAAFALFVAPFVVLFAFAGFLCIVPFGILPRGRRERFARPTARAFAWLCLRLALVARIDVVGAGALPTQSGFLVVSNHRSWADVALLILHTGSLGISKREIAWVPFFGLAGYLAGAIFFDRRSPSSRAGVVTDALHLLASGGRLHLFPEGTRTRDGRLSERVHLRLVKAAGEQGIPVVPACVWGTERAAPATSLAAFPLQRMGVELAAPMHRANFPDGESFASACWERVRAMAARRGADELIRP